MQHSSAPSPPRPRTDPNYSHSTSPNQYDSNLAHHCSLRDRVAATATCTSAITNALNVGGLAHAPPKAFDDRRDRYFRLCERPANKASCGSASGTLPPKKMCRVLRSSSFGMRKSDFVASIPARTQAFPRRGRRF